MTKINSDKTTQRPFDIEVNTPLQIDPVTGCYFHPITNQFLIY